MLNKQKGNMYPFVTHTWNVIKGKCPHDCIYCYMKKWGTLYQKPLYLDEKALKDDLGSSNFIFVGSSIDMFASGIEKEWIKLVLTHCLKYSDNKYLFQSKSPMNMYYFYTRSWFPCDSIFGTTIESDRVGETIRLSKADNVQLRAEWLSKFKNTMVSIEPIIDFDVDKLIELIKEVKPQFVSIGADSKGHKLPEPSEEKIKALIKELRKFTKVKIKDNLARLCPSGCLISV